MDRKLFLAVLAGAVALAGEAKFELARQPAHVQWTRVVSTDDDRYCGWPTVADIGNGELAVVFSGNRDTHVCPWGQVRMKRSKDGGKTWEPKVRVYDVTTPHGCTQLKDGSRPMRPTAS